MKLLPYQSFYDESKKETYQSFYVESKKRRICNENRARQEHKKKSLLHSTGFELGRKRTEVKSEKEKESTRAGFELELLFIIPRFQESKINLCTSH